MKKKNNNAVKIEKITDLIKLSQFYVLYTTKLNQIQFGPYL